MSPLLALSTLLLLLRLPAGTVDRADSFAGKHRALVIAIGDYPRIGGWDKLSSVQDAILMEQALQARGFSDLQLLVDSEATKAGIVQAFRDLTARCQPGDRVLLHFSGHGQQIWDHEDAANPALRVDELDGFDESLVPYDARDTFTPGVYEGEKHLVDDELSRLLTDLRARLGAEGQLLFTVDACYSGSISRSANLAKVRGTSRVIRPENHASPAGSPNRGTGWSESFVTSEQPLAQMAVISAARADQPNYETTDPQGNGVGSLSLSLSRTLVRPFDRAPSLGDFFRYVESDMARVAPFQSPQLEGDADRQLFGSALLDPGGFPVLSFGPDQRTATLRAGTLGGILPGTRVRLVPARGGEGVDGEVTRSDATTSTVTLSAPAPDPDPVAWRARVAERFVLFQPVQLALDVSRPELEGPLRAAIAATERLDIVDQGAQLLLRESDSGELQITDIQEKVLGAYPAGDPERAAQQALARVEEYARAQYFWSLSGQAGGGEGLELSVVPVTLTQAGNRFEVAALQEADLPPHGGVLSLPLATPFVFRVTNNSAVPQYVHVMGVDAADEVFLLLPDARTPPAELRIDPGKAVHLSRAEWIFQTADPPGKQLFLAFGSPDPIDLRPVFRQLSGPTRGAAAVSEGVWLSELLFGNTRSAGPGAELQTAGVVIDIMP